MFDNQWFFIFCCIIKITFAYKIENFISGSLAARDTRRIGSDCVLSVAKSYFPIGSSITLALSTVDSDGKSPISTDTILLSSLNNELNWSIFITKARAQKSKIVFENDLNLADSYVLQVRNVMEVEQNLKLLTTLHSWNPHANFLVLLNIVVDNYHTVISYFIERLWTKRQVLNVAILVHNPKNPTHLNCFTWLPYINGHCGDQFNDKTIIGECFEGVIHIAESYGTLFPEKIPNDLNGCPIRVQSYLLQPYVFLHDPEIINESNTTALEGVEVRLVDVIGQKLNLTPKYQISKTQNTLAYTLKQLATAKADLSIGAISPDNEKHKKFDFTHTYLDESVTWCVPSSEETPRWKNFIFSFTYQSWILIILAYISCSILTWYLSRNDIFESMNYRNLGALLVWNYSILMSISIPDQPRRASARYIILSYIIFCFIASVTFQTFLMSVLTEPTFESQISNFDELIESNLDYGIMESHRRFYEADPKYKEVLEKAKLCEDINICLYNVSSHKNLAVALPRLYINYIGARFLGAKGRSLIHAFKSDIVTYPIEMLMSKGFPLLEKINMIVLYMKETGLLMKWRTDFLSETKAMNNDITVEDEEENGLTLQEVQISFLIILIGCSVASLIFVIELCWKRF